MGADAIGMREEAGPVIQYFCQNMIDRETINRVIETLFDHAPEGSQVIVFGSYARGDATSDSDLGLLVVVPHLSDRRTEMVRLREALRPLRVPVDVLVVSEPTFDAWKDLPNNVINEAALEGRRYARAA